MEHLINTLPGYVVPFEDKVRAALTVRLPAAQTRFERVRMVAEAVRDLAGQYPSAAVVRAFLGSGSLSSIQADLEALKTPALPAPAVPSHLAGLLEPVWQEALSQAQLLFEAERAQLTAKEARIEQDLIDIQQQLDAVARDAQYQQDKLDTMAAENARLVEALRLAQEMTGAAEARTAGQLVGERSARMAAEAHAKEELQARIRLEEIRAGETQHAMMQIDDARAESRRLREELRTAQSDANALMDSYRQRASKAETEAGQTRLAMAELKGKLTVLEQQLQTQSRAQAKAHREARNRTLEQGRRS